MNKIFYGAVSFFICLVLGLPYEWLCFAPVFVLFSYKELSSSMIWEIPMGCVAADIVLRFCSEYEPGLFRWLTVAAAAVIALTSPKKLFLFFPLVIALLISKTAAATGTFIIAAALWCGIRSAFSCGRPFARIAPRQSADISHAH